MAKELAWKHSGDEATARGKKYTYRVTGAEANGQRWWSAILDGQPWEGYPVGDIIAAKRAAEEFAEKHDDFPRVLVTRSDDDRVIVEINPDPGNLATRVEVELSIHHTGGGVVVDIDSGSEAVIDVDMTSETVMLVRGTDIESWV